MKTTLLHSLALAALVGVAVPGARAQSSLNTWVNWTTPTMDQTVSGFPYASRVTGTLLNPNDNSTINVTYTGEADYWSAFNGTSPSGSVNNVWGAVPSTYLNSAVDTLPTYGNYVTTTGLAGVTQTVSFSSPVQNLIMPVASLGGAVSGTYAFDRPFVVLSTGPGNWGGGEVPLQDIGDNTLYGWESSGVIEFEGTFTSLSWTTPEPEIYSAFNFGISSVSPVPEPSVLALAALGGSCRLFFRRRRN